MRPSFSAFMIVQGVTAGRLLAAVAFAALSARAAPELLLALYWLALLTDYFDGLFARKLGVASSFGQAFDLIADKSLAAASLLYAAARGIDLLPIALIACRDLVTLGMRTVQFDGHQILPTSRWFGASLLVAMGGLSTLLVLSGSPSSFEYANRLYWVLALLTTTNVVFRFGKAGRIFWIRQISSGGTGRHEFP